MFLMSLLNPVLSVTDLKYETFSVFFAILSFKEVFIIKMSMLPKKQGLESPSVNNPYHFYLFHLEFPYSHLNFFFFFAVLI